MGALVNAATHAKNNAVGGFRDQALAALVNQARTTVSKVPTETDLTVLGYAKSVISDAPAFADIAAWAAATDAACSATATPTEAQINSAIVAAYPFLATLNRSYP